MTDIIKDAKQLLDGTTPAPWVTGGKDESGNIYVGNPSGEGNAVAAAGRCDADLIAAAPELAQALAEETYEYIVQVKRANEWQFYIGESHMVSDNPGAAYGFSQRSNALEFSKMETKRPTRIVRRRVSPVEVIE